jgi:hypothetical protein
MINEFETEGCIEVLNSTLEEDLAYIKNVELEFTESVDGILEMLNLSHLRVKDRILVE